MESKAGPGASPASFAPYAVGRTTDRAFGALHAKVLGATAALCGRDVSSWVRHYEQPFAITTRSCVECAAQVCWIRGRLAMPERSPLLSVTDKPFLGPVLAIGESLMDVAVRTTTAAVATPGGSPLNVAVALGRFGAPVDFYTHLGSDGYGALINRYLAAAGVNVIGEPSGSTGVASAHIGPDGSATYEFDLSWDPPTGRIRRKPVTVHTGSLALFTEPGGSAVMDVLRKHRAGSVISIDPNIRPSLIPSVAAARARFEDACSLADVVKLSEEDADWLYPGWGSRRVLDSLLRRGPRLVSVTTGAAGSVMASANACIEVAAVDVDIADTIGAGDAYMAGMLYQVTALQLFEAFRSGQTLNEQSLNAVASFAALVAAKTVEVQGANPPWFHSIRGGDELM